MSQDLATDTQLGEYVVEKTLGEGSFGITYLARDSRLGAKVAIKEYFPSAYAVRDPENVIAPKHDDQAQKIYRWGLEQFLKEAQALAQFKHTNIVRVLRFMESNGTAYMVMEYEPGQSLGDLLEASGGTLEQSQLLQIFIPILNGLQAMHDAGLVHLDIKPDNIYICADNRPILIDFGSASQIAAQKATGQVAITPAYAAIEHYPDKGKRGAWTDIYSIGASMYRCIAGNPPVGSMDRYKSILQYKKDPMVPAASLEISGYPDYLRDCIDWALEIYPQKRPHSAQMLQQGLMGKGRPGKGRATPEASTAKPATPPQTQSRPQPGKPQQFDEEGNRLVTDPWRIARWALAALIILMIGGSAVAWLMRPQSETHLATTESEVTIDTEMDATPSDPAAMEAVDSPPAHTTAVNPVQAPPTRLAERIGGHTNRVKALVISSDGQRRASADADGKILLWQPGQSLPVKTINAHQREINALAISPDGTLLASAGVDGLVKLWDTASGATKGVLKGHDYAVYALDFSPDGQLLASAGKDRAIVLWDLQSGSIRQELSGHDAAINTVRFSNDGRSLASGGEAIIIWSLQDGQSLGKLYAHKGSVLSLDYSNDGRWLASAGFGGTIMLWDLVDNRNINLSTTADTVFRVRFSPDNHWLASAGNNKKVQLWSVDNGNFYQELKGHEDAVLAVEFDEQGKTLFSGARDHKLIRWSR